MDNFATTTTQVKLTDARALFLWEELYLKIPETSSFLEGNLALQHKIELCAFSLRVGFISQFL